MSTEHHECVILDVTEFDQWHERPEQSTVVIPADKRSTVLQATREQAESEACRLALAHPGKRFAVLQVVGVVEAKSVPTHVTLGGKVVSTTHRPVWEPQP